MVVSLAVKLLKETATYKVLHFKLASYTVHTEIIKLIWMLELKLKVDWHEKIFLDDKA